jgi:uncharacterized protein (TIGR02391 family)
MLHEELRGAAYDALVRGNFQQAVAEAFRVVEVKARNASGLEGVGATLMRAAFHEDTGPLRSDGADRGERQALPHLFAGAFGWVRNPAIHRDIAMDDVTHAIEQLMLASLLLRIADERIVCASEPNPRSSLTLSHQAPANLEIRPMSAIVAVMDQPSNGCSLHHAFAAFHGERGRRMTASSALILASINRSMPPRSRSMLRRAVLPRRVGFLSLASMSDILSSVLRV